MTTPIKALRRLVDFIETLDAEEPGRGFQLFVSPGCQVCTHGSTPYKFDTGTCAYHEAKQSIRDFDKENGR